jgi:hypothetical protein
MFYFNKDGVFGAWNGATSPFTLNTAGNIVTTGGGNFSGGRYFFTDEEKCGRLRVGCAWGMPGIYAEDGKSLVIGGASGAIESKSKLNTDDFETRGNIKLKQWNMCQGNSGRLVFNIDGKIRANTMDPEGYFYTAWPRDYNEGDTNDQWYREARDGTSKI